MSTKTTIKAENQRAAEQTYKFEDLEADQWFIGGNGDLYCKVYGNPRGDDDVVLIKQKCDGSFTLHLFKSFIRPLPPVQLVDKVDISYRLQNSVKPQEHRKTWRPSWADYPDAVRCTVRPSNRENNVFYAFYTDVYDQPIFGGGMLLRNQVFDQMHFEVGEDE